MVAFVLICIFVGIILAFVMAPVLIVKNRQALKEMDDIIAEFNAIPAGEQRDAERSRLKTRLTEAKAKIWSGDRQAVEAARDKLSLI